VAATKAVGVAVDTHQTYYHFLRFLLPLQFLLEQADRLLLVKGEILHSALMEREPSLDMRGEPEAHPAAVVVVEWLEKEGCSASQVLRVVALVDLLR